MTEGRSQGRPSSFGGKRDENRELPLAMLEFLDWLDAKVLQDLSGCDRLWLNFVFHRNEGWKSSVRPPP